MILSNLTDDERQLFTKWNLVILDQWADNVEQNYLKHYGKLLPDGYVRRGVSVGGNDKPLLALISNVDFALLGGFKSMNTLFLQHGEEFKSLCFLLYDKYDEYYKQECLKQGGCERCNANEPVK